MVEMELAISVGELDTDKWITTIGFCNWILEGVRELLRIERFEGVFLQPHLLRGTDSFICGVSTQTNPPAWCLDRYEAYVYMPHQNLHRRYHVHQNRIHLP